MENTDSNTKPSQTGGLKLMTVFVFVIAAHVIVIASMCGYYLLKGPSTDADLLTDKTHKSAKAAADGSLISDGQMPDATDKSATASTTPTDAGAPAPTTAPALETDQPAPTDQPATTDSSIPAPLTTPMTATITPPTTAPTTTVLGMQPVPVQTGPVITPPSVAATPPPAIVESTAPVASGASYVVKPKDSLTKIAHLNHISVAKLKAANSLNTDMLHIGQKLVIPAKTDGAIAATTLDASATALTADSPTTGTLKPASAKAAVTPDLTASATDSHQHVYTVVKGDTLTKIAHKFKTTTSAIMTANSITDPAKLTIGKKLKIPSREARSAKNTEPPSTQPVEEQAKTGATTAQLANFVQ